MSKPPRRPEPQQIYQLTVELQHIEPRIWRTILVPDTLKLARLDLVVQAAFGWTNSHLHEWRIGSARYGIPDPEWGTQEDLIDERKCTVGKVLGDDVAEFTYNYDFGDGWEHRITVDQRSAVEPERNAWPMCIAGANACPPEDVGGPPGYMDFLQAMRDRTHEEHLQVWRWCGGPFDPAAFSLNDANRAIRDLR
ncbi:plasmid pRiA4b ORF-3 family protein [Aquabacterium humicola]|uniref:plasmid pRiA4b ORF-3 family protein n=1 Tax=Aquabacterium humicola TaxID=3237377 RepID=UPI0025427AE5|nr:plasmid pRiA4b ORF-3 family protein [Rubrivivax pictus]